MFNILTALFFVWPFIVLPRIAGIGPTAHNISIAISLAIFCFNLILMFGSSVGLPGIEVIGLFYEYIS